MLEYIPSYMYCMLVINIKKCMSTQSFIPMINFPLFFLFFLATHRWVVDHCMAIINEAEVRVIIIIIFRPSSCNSIWHTHTHILQQQQHNKKTFSFHSYMDINFHFLPNIISHTIVFSPGSSSTNHHHPTYHLPFYFLIVIARLCCLVFILCVYKGNNNASVVSW